MNQIFNPASRYILDTNLWLDWFVFAHDAAAPIALLKQLVASNAASVWMTQPMWDEWVDVLGRVQFKVEPERQARILAQTRALVNWVDTPSLPFERIRCADKDDQVFIDAALALKVDCLISKDKHLLRLRARAKKQGVTIVTPEQWVQQFDHAMRAEMVEVVHA